MSLRFDIMTLFPELVETVHAVCEAQRDSQKNLHNTLAVVQTLSADAQEIQKAAAQIAANRNEMNEAAAADLSARSEKLQAAEKAGEQLTEQLEELSASLRRMQLVVDTLTNELNGSEKDE